MSFSKIFLHYIFQHLFEKEKKIWYNLYRSGDIMNNLKENDIIKVRITGIQNYGAFADIEGEYNGLIHISEISYGYVKNIHDFINVGDDIFAEVVSIDDDNKRIKLSIKDIDYKKNGTKLKRLAETKNGFNPLKENLDKWINEKIKEITDNF